LQNASRNVQIGLIRRDSRRTCQDRFSSIQKEAGSNTGIVGNEAATVCLIERAASSVFEMFVSNKL
jgi:hypothetical protein